MPKRFTEFAVQVCLICLFLTGCSSMPFVSSSKSESVVSEGAADGVRQDDKIEVTGGSFAAPQGPAIVVPTPPVKGSTTTKFERALVLLQAEDWAVAESILEEITRAQPELAGPWVNLAIAQLGQGNDKAAKQSLKEAVVANPHNCDARNRLGILARQAGDFAQAEDHYRKCLKANPGYLDAQLNLGILYELYLGRYSEALAAYQDYQLALVEPDPRINGWLLDLERRVAALAQR